MTFERHGESKFDAALRYAIEVHAGMRRKGDDVPYIIHPLEAATIAATMTGDEDTLCAALLHDVIEDTPASYDDVCDAFGERVAELVAAESENKRPDLPSDQTWLIRKEESLAELQATDDLQVKIIWLSDKLSNMRSFARMHEREGDALWSRFNQKDPAMQAWYYRQVAEATNELSALPAWKEFVRLSETVFEGVE